MRSMLRIIVCAFMPSFGLQLAAEDVSAHWHLSVTIPAALTPWLGDRMKGIHGELLRGIQGAPATGAGKPGHFEQFLLRDGPQLITHMAAMNKLSVQWQAGRHVEAWQMDFAAHEETLTDLLVLLYRFVQSPRGLETNEHVALGPWSLQRQQGSLRIHSNHPARPLQSAQQPRQGIARLSGRYPIRQVPGDDTVPQNIRWDLEALMDSHGIINWLGHLELDLRGLAPLNGMKVGPLPANQQGLLIFSLAQEERLSPLIANALSLVTKRLGGLAFDPAHWEGFAGPIIFTWKEKGLKPLLSMAVQGEETAAKMARILGGDHLDPANLLRTATHAAQVIRRADNSLWWVRQDPAGYFWFSPDQRFLAQRVGGIWGKAAPYESINADTLCSFQLNPTQLARQAQSFMTDNLSPQQRHMRRHQDLHSRLRMGTVVFPVLSQVQQVSHLQIGVGAGGRSRHAMTWRHPEVVLFPLWWVTEMDSLMAQVRRNERRTSQLRDWYLSWRRGEVIADHQLATAVALPWPTGDRGLKLLVVDSPYPAGRQGGLGLFSDGSVVWLHNAQAIHRRSIQLQRILQTGHIPRDPWGDLEQQIEADYNLHHTGDPSVSPF